MGPWRRRTCPDFATIRMKLETIPSAPDNLAMVACKKGARTKSEGSRQLNGLEET